MKEVTIGMIQGTEFVFFMNADVTQQIVRTLNDTHTRVIVIPGSAEQGEIHVVKQHVAWIEVEDVRRDV